MGGGFDLGGADGLATRVEDWPTLALRAEETSRGLLVSGLAAPYGEVAVYAGVREQIEAGAFAGVLGSERDVLALLDHDVHQLLGRTSKGTLKLRDVAAGLAFELWLRDTPWGREIFEQVKRGDFGGVSFGFKESASRYVERNGVKRWLMLDMYEVSLITPFAAYKRTRVEVGGLDSERASLREWLAVRDWRG